MLRRHALEDQNTTSLHARARECRVRFQRMMQRRPGVMEHVRALEADVSTRTSDLRAAAPRGFARRSARAAAPAPARPSLAVLVRGQTFRGEARESFLIDRWSQASRERAQRECLESLVARLVVPYERAGHTVDVFLTMYRELGGSRAALLDPFGARVAAVTTVLQRSTATQLLPLGAAVRAFLNWCHAHATSYSAVAVTRFDVFYKADLYAILGDAAAIDGFRLLWREAGGHWRHHSDPVASERTFPLSARSDWRRSNVRAPDALIAFPYAYTRCFLASSRHEFFPVRNKSWPLGFMHNMVFGLMRALPFFSGKEGGGAAHHLPATASTPPHAAALARSAAAATPPAGAAPPANAPIPPGLRWLVRGQFDSNPCRSTCMLNPVYDLLPRMEWVRASGICQSPSDFAYDEASDSLCCPSPNYCCPNSLASCAHPDAVLFDAISANVSRDAIAQLWPLTQGRPRRWLMTPRSMRHVAGVWRQAAADAEGAARVRTLSPFHARSLRAPPRLREAAAVLEQQAAATSEGGPCAAGASDRTPFCRG